MAPTKDLAEYDAMGKEAIVTKEEIDIAKRKRRAFEREISTNKDLKKMKEYIGYERSLLATVKEREKEKKIIKQSETATFILERIRRLFVRATERFPSILSVWEDFVNFLSRNNMKDQLPGVWDDALHEHSGKPDLWVNAMKYVLEEDFNDKRLRHLFQRGQQKCHDSEKIYLMFFHAELLNKSKVSDESALTLAKNVLENGKKRFPNVEFYGEMLKIADKFPYASSISDDMVKEMSDKFAHHEYMWDVMSGRELYRTGPEDELRKEMEAAVVNLDADEAAEKRKSYEKQLDELEKKRIQQTVASYLYSIEVFGSDRMWEYYLKAMHDLNKDLTWQKQAKQTFLLEAMEAGYAQKKLTEEMCLRYTDLLKANKSSTEKKIVAAYEQGVELYPNSDVLWTSYVGYHMTRKELKKVKTVFYRAVDKLDENSLLLWQRYFLFLRVYLGSEPWNEFRTLTDVIAKKGPEFNSLKTKIIQLTSTSLGIKHAFKIFTKITDADPNCYVAYDTMLKELQNTVDAFRDETAEREMHESIVKQFGKDRKDVWIQYLSWEREYGDDEQVRVLSERALQMINKDMKPTFEAEIAMYRVVPTPIKTEPKTISPEPREEE